MPTQIAGLDTNFPSFTGQEDTEEKVNQLYDYTFMLLENLRYILRNLDWGNFTQEAQQSYPGRAEQSTIREISDINTTVLNQLSQNFSDYFIDNRMDQVVNNITNETNLQTIMQAITEDNHFDTFVTQIADNSNMTTAIEQTFEGNTFETIVNGLAEDQVRALIADSIATDELYANYGEIADLVVKELRTDYSRIDNYLDGSTLPLDYIHIHDEEIDFITGTPTGSVEQFHHGDRYFWWTDATMTRMTSEGATDFPVMVYVYNNALKGTFRFDTVDGTKIPVIVLGAGVGDQTDPDKGKGYLRKETDSFNLFLQGSGGVYIGDEYTDIVGLRKTTSLDFSTWDSGSFTEIIDGNVSATFSVTLDGDGAPTSITDDEGHTTSITW